MEKNIKIVSFSLYIVSFFLPVFNGDKFPGIAAFFVGVLTNTVPWMANVFFIIALALKKDDRNEKLLCCVIAIALACKTFSIHEIRGIGSESEPTKVSIGIGFFFWFSSFIIFAISILFGKYAVNKIPHGKTPPPLN